MAHSVFVHAFVPKHGRSLIDDWGDDETAIRQLVADRTNLMHVGNADTICRPYTSDAIIFFSLSPPLVQPPDDTRDVAKMQTWFDEKGGRVWSEVRDLGSPSRAVHPVVTVSAHRRPMADRPRAHVHSRFRIGGSFRAATDLQP